MPADTVAIKFWLVNREKERWSDNPNKVEIDKELLELRKQQVKNEEW